MPRGTITRMDINNEFPVLKAPEGVHFRDAEFEWTTYHPQAFSVEESVTGERHLILTPEAYEAVRLGLAQEPTEERAAYEAHLPDAFRNPAAITDRRRGIDIDLGDDEQALQDQARAIAHFAYEGHTASVDQTSPNEDFAEAFEQRGERIRRATNELVVAMPYALGISDPLESPIVLQGDDEHARLSRLSSKIEFPPFEG